MGDGPHKLPPVDHMKGMGLKRPFNRWRDDLDDCWRDTIWQRSTQEKQTETSY